MPRHRRRDPMFRYRRHDDETSRLAIRRYISCPPNLRDLTEMLDDRDSASVRPPSGAGYSGMCQSLSCT